MGNARRAYIWGSWKIKSFGGHSFVYEKEKFLDGTNFANFLDGNLHFSEIPACSSPF